MKINFLFILKNFQKNCYSCIDKPTWLTRFRISVWRQHDMKPTSSMYHGRWESNTPPREPRPSRRCRCNRKSAVKFEPGCPRLSAPPPQSNAQQQQRPPLAALSSHLNRQLLSPGTARFCCARIRSAFGPLLSFGLRWQPRAFLCSALRVHGFGV